MSSPSSSSAPMNPQFVPARDFYTSNLGVLGICGYTRESNTELQRFSIEDFLAMPDQIAMLYADPDVFQEPRTTRLRLVNESNTPQNFILESVSRAFSRIFIAEPDKDAKNERGVSLQSIYLSGPREKPVPIATFDETPLPPGPDHEVDESISLFNPAISIGLSLERVERGKAYDVCDMNVIHSQVEKLNLSREGEEGTPISIVVTGRSSIRIRV